MFFREDYTASASCRQAVSRKGKHRRPPDVHILSAIDSVPDETQKTILTMRYIEGLSWEQIQFKTHCVERQVFILHGRGLRQVNLWIESQQIDIILHNTYLQYVLYEI